MAAELTYDPGPAQEARMTQALASKTLVELPFFSSQPDSSTHRRFCDTRKSQFVARMHRQEMKTQFSEHPQVKWPATIPDPTFSYEANVRCDRVLKGPEVALSHPFARGRGVQRPSYGVNRFAVGSNPGCSEMFPRFDFDVSSTALSSSAYGRHVPFGKRKEHGGHVPCAAFAVQGKTLQQQNAEQKAAVEKQREENGRAMAAAQRQLGRSITQRYGNSSSNVSRLLDMGTDD